MVKVDSLVKLHILPRDGVARAERLETWEDVAAARLWRRHTARGPLHGDRAAPVHRLRHVPTKAGPPAKEEISRAPPPPPPAEEDVRLADAAHSVGGFGRLVKNKVKAAVGRGKDREEPTSPASGSRAGR
eukprot:EG_transcript_29979